MLVDRRVKIVCTMGPALSSEAKIREAIVAGMNVSRLNFSHGSHEDYRSTIQKIRSAIDELRAPVSILQDLQGPKIRVGRFVGGSVELRTGETVTISTLAVEGEGSIIGTDFKKLPSCVESGTRILLDDGMMELRVLSVEETDIQCEVIFGGVLKNNKGMNLPDVVLPTEGLTEKDKEDLKFGLAQKVDFVAMSFVRTGEDIRKLRDLIQEWGGEVQIIAKIEMKEALVNLEDIVHLSDGIMVARGDLAVEVGQSLLPGIQKRIIKLCNRLGKPVITATQMLDSMVENPRPTRAEITDVANAVLDGSDGIMLSAESASGHFPIECIETMNEIAVEAERMADYYVGMGRTFGRGPVAESVAASACLSAQRLEAKAIVCLSTTGKTASMIAAYRPKAMIIAATNSLLALNRLELVWGIQTFLLEDYSNAEEAMWSVEKLLVSYGLVEAGDRVVMTLGVPVVQKVKTNSLRVIEVSEKIDRLPKDKIPFRCR